MVGTDAPTVVLSCEGELLAEAALFYPAGAASAGAILRSLRPQKLTQHYFGRGRRDVVVRRGSDGWQGRIVATRWAPEGREWVVAKAS
jgi:hypothetical protein